MFKLVVLSALVAIVAARPSHIAAPWSIAAPVVAVPSAVSSSYRVDVHSKPVIATYAAPIIQKTVVAAAPVAYTAPIVEKVVAAPIALSAAVSHQSRVDVHHGHAVVAPVAYAAPAIHAW